MRMTETVLRALATKELDAYALAIVVGKPLEATRSALRRLEKTGRVEKAGFDVCTGRRLWRLK